MKQLTAAFGIGLILLAGCTATGEYGKPAPKTVQGCQADYFAYQDRARRVNASNNAGAGGNLLANIIGTAIGKGLAEGAHNNRYRECLAGVGVENAATAPLPRRVAAAQPIRAASALPRPASCPRGYRGMYRGTLYC